MAANGLTDHHDRRDGGDDTEDREAGSERGDRVADRLGPDIERERLELLPTRDQPLHRVLELRHRRPRHQPDPEVRREHVGVALDDIEQGRAGEEGCFAVLDEVIRPARHTDDAKVQLWSARWKVVLGVNLLGAQGGDRDVVADVNAGERGRQLVDDHLVAPCRAGPAASHQPVPLDRRIELIAVRNPQPKVLLDAVDNGEEDRS